MDKDINVTFQTVIGLAALVDLLEEKGIFTEAEYEAKFEEIKNFYMDSIIEKIKKKFS